MPNDRVPQNVKSMVSVRGGSGAKDPRDNLYELDTRTKLSLWCKRNERHALHRKGGRVTQHCTTNEGSVKQWTLHNHKRQCWERPTILGLSTPAYLENLTGLLPWAVPQVGDDNPKLENRWGVVMSLGSGTRCELLSHLARDDNPTLQRKMRIEEILKITHTHQRKNTQNGDSNSVNKQE
jgi:hypothetical protein